MPLMRLLQEIELRPAADVNVKAARLSRAWCASAVLAIAGAITLVLRPCQPAGAGCLGVFTNILVLTTVGLSFGAELLGGRLLPKVGTSLVEGAFAAIPFLLMALWVADFGILIYFVLVGGLSSVLALFYVMFVAGLFPVESFGLFAIRSWAFAFIIAPAALIALLRYPSGGEDERFFEMWLALVAISFLAPLPGREWRLFVPRFIREWFSS